MNETEIGGGGGLHRAGDAAPSMAAVRRTRGRRETRLLGVTRFIPGNAHVEGLSN
jgi:hypothetical protein